MKTLLIYPNINEEPQVQVGIALISSVLKKNHTVDMFDVTFMMDKKFDDIVLLFEKKISEFKPDLLLISCRSLEYPFAVKLLTYGNNNKIPVVMGGIHPTVCPDEVINSGLVDYLCVGEGEEAVLELVDKLEKKEDISQIKNIWYKHDDEVIKNDVRLLNQKLDDLPYPDWSIFDNRHINNFGRFETGRGCPYNCTYCFNAYSQKLYKGKGKYHREKSTRRIIDEIKYFVKKFNLKKVSMIDDTFTIDKVKLKEFCEVYKKEVGLPFTVLSRPEGVTEDVVKTLKDSGCILIKIGVESGDPDYRKKYLNRYCTQEQIINAFKLTNKYKIKNFSYNMIGLPNQDRKGIFETIKLNKQYKVDGIQATYFYPFNGTKLGDYCMENNLINKDVYLDNCYNGSVVHNPNISQKELDGLFRTFIIYVKSPKIFFPLIRVLELDNIVSIHVCKIINTFIKQGFNFKALGFMFKYLIEGKRWNQ